MTINPTIALRAWSLSGRSIMPGLAVLIMLTLSWQGWTDDQPPQPTTWPPAETFTCETADGVTLAGDFYPAPDTRRLVAPCVVLLHPIGPGKAHASRRDFGLWPEELRKAGFAVITFDFRGYGDSKAIDAEKFWSQHTPRTPNQIKSTKIDNQDFMSRSDWLHLVNDLVAIKVWMNLQNNDRRCHSHALFLIGFEQAALLGTLWMTNELQDAQRPMDVSSVRLGRIDRYEGDDLAGAIWVSMTDRLGMDRVEGALIQRWFSQLRLKPMPLHGVFGENDRPSREFWNWIAGSQRGQEKKREEPILGTTLIEGTSLMGLKLLDHEALQVKTKIIQALKQQAESLNRPWSVHKGNLEPSMVDFRPLGF